MAIRFPNSRINKRHASAPKARVSHQRKPSCLRPFSAIYPLQYCKGHCKGQRGANVRHPGPFLCPPGADFGPLHGKPPCSELGPPLGIREVAELIGCSPWTVRQTLIPRGLPHFRSAASGRLIFYTNQIVGWIQSQQFQGGN
jgi:hypothetical protein